MAGGGSSSGVRLRKVECGSWSCASIRTAVTRSGAQSGDVERWRGLDPRALKDTLDHRVSTDGMRTNRRDSVQSSAPQALPWPCARRWRTAMHIDHRNPRVRRGFAFVALAAVLGLAAVGLSQCRMVNDSGTGVERRSGKGTLSARSACVKAGHEQVKDGKRNGEV